MLRHSLHSLVVVLVSCPIVLAQAPPQQRKPRLDGGSSATDKKIARPSPPTVDITQKVQPGQRVWPGQVLATVDDELARPKAPVLAPCIELDVLMGCVVFDEKGELRLKREDAEPEVNRAGTIGANLAAMLNEKKEVLPAGVSPGAAGANFLLEGLAGEEKLGQLEQFRLRLRADGSKASCQNGRRVPRITGASSSRSGQMVNTLSMDDMGSLVSGTAQITESEGIAVELSVESSSLGPEEEGTPLAVSEENTIRTPRIDLLTIQTQFTAADGESIVLSSLVRLWRDKVTETFVVVTATIVK